MHGATIRFTKKVGSGVTHNGPRPHPQTNQLMLSGETDHADCENRTVHVNTICEQNADFRNVTADGSTYVFTSVLQTVTDAVPTCCNHHLPQEKPLNVVLGDDRSLW